VDLQNIIGMFVNVLPLRNQPDDHKTFIEFLTDVKNKVIDAMENQDYQFDQLVSKLDIKRNSGKNPLVNVVFNMIDFESKETGVKTDTKIKPYNFKNGSTVFDLILSFSYRKENTYLSMIYSTQLFDKTTIEKMSGWYLDILNQVLKGPETKLQDIRLIHDLMVSTSNEHTYEESEFGF